MPGSERSRLDLSHRGLGTLGGVILCGPLVGYDTIYVRSDETVREVLHLQEQSGGPIVLLEAVYPADRRCICVCDDCKGGGCCYV